MLYYVENLPINVISAYHRIEKHSNIRSTEIYKNLKKDIKNNGINDPILIRNIKGVLQTHVGEQRFLIANDLKMKTMKAFIYNEFSYDGLIIKDVKDVLKYFKDATVPACITILGYIKHGQIIL